MIAEPLFRPSAKVAQESLVPPSVLAEIVTPAARVQILDWLWPEVFESTSVEHELMLELSLPPLVGMATATFPTIAPGTVCPFGTLFLRYPGIAITTHAEGGHVRILRCTFAESNKQALIGGRHPPSLGLLQRLIALRSDALRSLMRLLLRELESLQPGSPAAAEALVNLVEIELKRLFDQDFEPKAGGRLAPWQFRRLRERLEAGGERPSVPPPPVPQPDRGDDIRLCRGPDCRPRQVAARRYLAADPPDRPRHRVRARQQLFADLPPPYRHDPAGVPAAQVRGRQSVTEVTDSAMKRRFASRRG
jgi:hypothetical protein